MENFEQKSPCPERVLILVFYPYNPTSWVWQALVKNFSSQYLVIVKKSNFKDLYNFFSFMAFCKKKVHLHEKILIMYLIHQKLFHQHYNIARGHFSLKSL